MRRLGLWSMALVWLVLGSVGPGWAQQQPPVEVPNQELLRELIARYGLPPGGRERDPSRKLPPPTGSGEFSISLLSQCVHYIISNKPTPDGGLVLGSPRDQYSSYCGGFLLALQMALLLKGDDGKGLLGICMPAQTNPVTFMTRVFRYAERFPERVATTNASFLVLEAALYAWPCKAPAQ